MHFFFIRARNVATGVLLAIGAALAACTANPDQERRPPQTSGPPASGPTASISQLQLFVFDQNSTPLYDADVSLRATGGGSYRGRERTNGAGVVIFDRVPRQELQVDVNYQRMEALPDGRTRLYRGTGSRSIDVDAEYAQTEIRVEVIFQDRPL